MGQLPWLAAHFLARLPGPPPHRSGGGGGRSFCMRTPLPPPPPQFLKDTGPSGVTGRTIVGLTGAPKLPGIVLGP